MIPKTEPVMESIRKSHRYFKNFGPTDERYINDNLLIDMMLKEQTHVYVGGAGSLRRLRRGHRPADDVRGHRR